MDTRYGFEFHDLKRESFESKYICQRDLQTIKTSNIDMLSAEKFTGIYSYQNKKSLLYRTIKPSTTWWNYFQDAGTITAVFDQHQTKLEELHSQLITEEYEIKLTIMSIKINLIRELTWCKISNSKHDFWPVVVLPEIIENIITQLKIVF